ncbi:MAG: hypothetical protein ABW204_05070, partial [Microbacteriaceae bacterium]
EPAPADLPEPTAAPAQDDPGAAGWGRPSESASAPATNGATNATAAAPAAQREGATWGKPARPAESQPAAAPSASAPEQPAARTSSLGERQRYGESVVRELLGATFVEEQPLVTRAPTMSYDSED